MRGRKTGGRVAGVPNKATGDIKAMVLGALSDVGGRDYLAARALDQPVAFMGLIGRVLPLQLSGQNGGPVEMVITGVRRAIEQDDEPEPITITVTGVERADDVDTHTDVSTNDVGECD